MELEISVENSQHLQRNLTYDPAILVLIHMPKWLDIFFSSNRTVKYNAFLLQLWQLFTSPRWNKSIMIVLIWKKVNTTQKPGWITRFSDCKAWLSLLMGSHVIGSSCSKLGTCRSLLVIWFCQSLSEWWESHWQDNYYDLSISLYLCLSLVIS